MSMWLLLYFLGVLLFPYLYKMGSALCAFFATPSQSLFSGFLSLGNGYQWGVVRRVTFYKEIGYGLIP